MGVYGQQRIESGNTPENQLSFVIQQMLGRLNIATLVQVVAVYPYAVPSGAFNTTAMDSEAMNASSTSSGPVGVVDVLPLVGQVDGSGAIWPATTIYGVPYFRYQGGGCAVICDPAVNDIGFALFADRDISSVKASYGAAGPASERRFDFADALYFGGWNVLQQPSSYVQVTPNLITIVNPSNILLQVGGASAELSSSALTVNANLVVNGTSEVTGNATFDSQTEVKGLLIADENLQIGGTVTGAGGGGNLNVGVPIVSTSNITANGIDLESHVHTGVQTGGGTTGGPTG